MRVAAEISLSETPRISRSRLRCSPKGVEDIRWEPAKNIDAGRISVNDTRAQLKGTTHWPFGNRAVLAVATG